MKRILAIALLTMSFNAAAQLHPNRDRGFVPSRVYDFSSVDNVNLFNGNLVVTIPIGQTYQVSRTLSYRLNLVHSGNVWTMLRKLSGTDIGIPQEEQYPNPRSNAGLGWQLSLGQMVTPTDPFNSSSGPVDAAAWVYVTPDGSEHALGAGPQTENRFLGMRRTALTNGDQKIEMADGSIHTFDGTTGRLKKIEDRFGYFVQIDYVSDLLWRIFDSTSREHYIAFKTDSTNSYAAIVDYVELASFDGRAKYQFTYRTPEIFRGCEHSEMYGVPTKGRFPLLETITLPDGPTAATSSKYSMTYEESLQNSDCVVTRASSGSLKSLTLPTGAKYEWVWQIYGFPIESSPAKSFRSAPGVRYRIVTEGATSSSWGYEWQIPNENTFCSQPKPGPIDPDDPNTQIYCYSPEMINTATSPDGTKTVRYFSTYAGGPGRPEDNTLNWDSEEYGLNFSRRETDGTPASRFISTQSTDATGTKLTTEYRRYEGGNEGRLKATRTLHFESNNVYRYADVENYGYDGYGHYRQTSTGGNFSGDNFRTTFTNYQGPLNEWILNTYSEQCQAIDGSQRSAAIASCADLPGASVTKFTFDQNTGFLKQTRTLLGSSLTDSDLLTVFSRSANGVTETVAEGYYGGDACALNMPGCDTNSEPKYKILNTYIGGVLSKSQYAGFNFFRSYSSLNANTGLASSVFDTSGTVEVQYDYDALGRIESATPMITPKTGKTTWEYSSGAPPAIVTERSFAVSPEAEILEKKWIFDGLGRVKEEQIETPGGTSSRTTAYDEMGRVRTLSEFAAIGAVQHVTTTSYDALGRVRTSTGPDASVLTNRYAGARLVERKVRRATSAAGQTDTFTCEEYDRFGRLYQVHEGGGFDTSGQSCSSPGTVTTYSYDERDRLIKVAMSAEGKTQERLFVFDKRGFLTSEKHPEKNSATLYLSYDSRGHAARRQDGSALGPFDVSFKYDGAERLTEVRESGGGQRVLKEFLYADDNDCPNGVCDLRKGKLWQATRHNWVGTATNVKVTDTYTYSGKDGAISKKVTTVVDGPHVAEFTQNYAHDDLGNTSSITYPTCGSCGAGTARTVSSDYVSGKGFLTFVSGFTTAAPNGITYWPNGATKVVAHSNGVDEKQFIDESTGMVRPLRFEFTGWSNPPQCPAPTLTGPVDTTVAYGATASLSVTAQVATGTLSYAWFRGTAPDQSNPVGNGTNSLTTPSLYDNTSYWVKVTNACNSSSTSTNSATTAVKVRMATPLNVDARPLPDGTIRVTWDSVSGATSYTVLRKQGAGTFTSVSASASPYSETAVAYVGYVFRVIANRSTAEPSFESAGDVAVRVTYTQPNIIAGSPIRGADIGELRQAIDGVRIVAGLPAAWASYAPATGLIFASQFVELHSKLSEARAQLGAAYGVPAVNLGSPAAQGTLIDDQTINALRGGVQ